jgi:hypothetical protein
MEEITFEYNKELNTLGDLTEIKIINFNGGFKEEFINEIKMYPSIEKITVDVGDIELHLNVGPLKIHFEFICNHIKLSGDTITSLEVYTTKNVDLTDLSNLQNLEYMMISYIPEWCHSQYIKNIKGIEKLNSLKTLILDGMDVLISIEGIEKCELLEKLSILKCKAIKDLSPILKLNNLKMLDLSYCRNLEFKPKPYCMNFEELLKYKIEYSKFLNIKINETLLSKYEEAKLNRPKKYSPSLMQKVRRLLNSGNMSLIESGLSIIEGLDDIKIFDELFKNISCENGNVCLDEFLRGTNENKPYKNYTFLRLSKMACKFDEWKQLCDKIVIWNKETIKQGPVDHFVNLKELELFGFNETEFPIKNYSVNRININRRGRYHLPIVFDIKHLEGCVQCLYLNIKEVSVLKNGFSELRNLINLEEVYISFSQFIHDRDIKDSLFYPLSFCEKIKTLSIEYLRDYNNSLKLSSYLSYLDSLTSLHTLLITGINFNDIEFIKNLNLMDRIRIINNETLENITLPKIKSSLELDNLPKLFNIKSDKQTDITVRLSNCIQLNNINFLSEISNKYNYNRINIENCPSLKDISGINNFTNFNQFTIYSENIPFTLNNTNIKIINSRTIRNLKGIENFKKLEVLDLENNQNLIEIIDLKLDNKLKVLNLSKCENLISLKGLINCEVDVLILCDTKSIKDFSDLNEMNLKELYIAGSSLKKSDISNRLQPILNWRSRPKLEI